MRDDGSVTERMRICVEPEASAADIDAVRSGLHAYNVDFIGPSNQKAMQIFLRGESGDITGGLLGEMRWQWLYVAKLWVSDELRGQGYGSELLAAAESHAREEGCIGIFLDTFEYQARPFYEKLGFTLFGTLEGYPPGYRQFYLAKRIA